MTATLRLGLDIGGAFTGAMLSGPPAAQGEMEVFAASVIAGDALTGFYNGVAANLRR